MNGLQRVKRAGSGQILRLRSGLAGNENDTILHLGFDVASPTRLRDRSGFYRIEDADYIPSTDAWSGERAALFNRPENRIVIRSPQSLWPGQGSMGDFSVEMRIKPAYFTRRATLFLRSGRASAFRSGRRSGIEIGLYRRRILVRADGIFRDSRAHPRSLILESRTSLRANRWTHILIGYRAAQGRLSLYIDGKEERSVRTGDSSGLWDMRFEAEDRVPIVIGRNYIGLIDEFRIMKKAPEREENIVSSRYPPVAGKLTREGVAISPVITLARPARRAVIRYDATEPTGTSIFFWVRYSDRPFRADDFKYGPPWKSLDRVSSTLSEFSYYQWKAKLRSDPGGQKSPSLKDVRMDYVTYSLPSAPSGLKVVRTYQRQRQRQKISFLLEWNAVPAPGIAPERIKYIVYYGKRSGEYRGRLELVLLEGKYRRIASISPEKLPLLDGEKRFRRLRPLSFRRRMRNRIRIIVSNDMIERNIVAQLRRGRREKMPLLQEGRAFYFAVTAVYMTGSGTSRRAMSGKTMSGKTMNGKTMNGKTMNVRTMDGRTMDSGRMHGGTVLESPLSREVAAVARLAPDLR